LSSYVITDECGRIIALAGREDDARMAAGALSGKYRAAVVHVRPKRAGVDIVARYEGGVEIMDADETKCCAREAAG